METHLRHEHLMHNRCMEASWSSCHKSDISIWFSPSYRQWVKFLLALHNVWGFLLFFSENLGWNRLILIMTSSDKNLKQIYISQMFQIYLRSSTDNILFSKIQWNIFVDFTTHFLQTFRRRRRWRGWLYRL